MKSQPRERRVPDWRMLRTMVALLAALALVAAACGGDDDDDGAAGDDTAGESSGDDGSGDDADDGDGDDGASDDDSGDGDGDDSGDGDGDDSGDGDGGGDAPSGEPIKVMTVTTLNAAGPTYENIANTANVYADWINARGGIAGRPLEVTVCDEQFDPAVATTCARQAVEEGMVSVVGSFTFFAESIVPVIAESDITWFGPCCPITPSELTSPHSFPIGNQPMYAVGAVKRAVDDGCQNINAVIIEGAQIFIPPMENAITALGQSFGEIGDPAGRRPRTTRPRWPRPPAVTPTA